MNSLSNNKNRAVIINRNFFLHIHAIRVHPHALKPAYTFGLGIMLGFLFIILLLSGIVLLFYYTPSVESAYNSVKDIVFIVPGGRIIRNIHRWAGHGMVLLAFLHLIRVFYTASYSGKRTTNWLIGVSLLFITLMMSFSGYLLPWDQLAFWAVTIGANIASSANELTDLLGITSFVDVGGFLKKILIGDENVGQPALTRFFALHIFLLPATFTILTSIHLWRIRKDGGLSRPVETEPDSKARNKTEKWYSWPVLPWVELSILLFLITVILFISSFINAPLLEMANPSLPENPAKSPWYFLGIQEMVSYSAFTGGILVPLLFMVFLISIPFIDKEVQYTGHWFSGQKGLKYTLLSTAIALAITLITVFIYIRFGWLRDWFPDISQGWVLFFNPASIMAVTFILYSVHVRKKTRSSRMAAIVLFSAALTALIVLTIIGIWFRGPNWEFYWSSSQWPTI